MFKTIVLQFKEFYKNLTPTKRVAAAVASFVVMGATIVMMVMISGKDYQVLFRDLTPEQATTIMGKLREKNIDFRVEDGGATITVPNQLVHTTQMAMAAELGGTKIGTIGGLELFDKQDFGATSYAQRINYQRALQGELTRAIRAGLEGAGVAVAPVSGTPR